MKTTKVFTSGNSQAVRLPKDFRFEEKEVYIKKMGDAIVLFPKDKVWNTMFNSLGNFTKDFMSEREQPPLDNRDEMFE